MAFPKNQFLFVVALGATVLLVLTLNGLQRPNTVDRSPHWHPFEVNSALTLEALVEDGYRFAAAPCGQVQFIKTVGDNSIQYEVEITCPIEAEISSCDKVSEEKTLEETIAKNPYYPFCINDIQGCKEIISWRLYHLKLGKTIDSLKIIQLVESFGGYVRSIGNGWTTATGGNVLVYYAPNELLFYCLIQKEYEVDSLGNPIDSTFVFSIADRIPNLAPKPIIVE
ncbi:MAG: hypothetical protein ACFB10_17595 [Salibacteraceae bacterium]